MFRLGWIWIGEFLLGFLLRLNFFSKNQYGDFFNQYGNCDFTFMLCTDQKHENVLLQSFIIFMILILCLKLSLIWTLAATLYSFLCGSKSSISTIPPSKGLEGESHSHTLDKCFQNWLHLLFYCDYILNTIKCQALVIIRLTPGNFWNLFWIIYQIKLLPKLVNHLLLQIPLLIKW